MTTIGSTKPYYASLHTIYGRNGGDKGDTGTGGDTTLPRQTQSGGMTGSGTVFGAKLADALWSMESQGVEIDQNTGDTWLGEPPSTAVEDEFMALAKKTYAERIREQYLDAHGLTEEDLKAMSPEDREAIEAEIRKAILEAMGVNGQKQETAMTMGGDPAAAGGQTDGGQTGGAPAGTAGRKNGKDDPLLSM
ncbi:hypothetical protein [Rhizobium terrae]|uniref:hypothetical protein n=1 Tax=Rhizobium terrae TaxID=2171756 RepID=UPI000E3C9BF4|nr:hypothetical protein [Rhizobium terrae]